MTWKHKKLGDVIVIKKGTYITKKEAREGPYPVILGGKEPAYYIDRFNHDGKAIVVSRSGASAGYVSFWNEPIFITDGFLIEPQDGIDHDFLYYLVKSHQPQLQGLQGGAAIPHVNPRIINSIDVCIPDEETQCAIVQKVQQYDALIENNQKQIKLLDEAAKRLYKEWFADLRFPGYENTSIVDGVPDGWEKQKLNDLTDVQYGFAFDGTLFNSDGTGTPIVRIRNIPSGTTSDYTTEDAPAQYRVYNGDILVGMDGEFHINSWCGDEAYLVQRTCRFKPVDEKMKGWLLYAIYEPIKFFEKTVVGATVAHLGKKHIDSIELLTGPKQLYEPFQLYFEKRQLLLNQNRKLAEARDRLLPKLMSGEIEI